jgi:hypothetical protein
MAGDRVVVPQPDKTLILRFRFEKIECAVTKQSESNELQRPVTDQQESLATDFGDPL